MQPLKAVSRVHFTLLLTGLLALWGSADAQTSTQGETTTNSAASTIAPHASVAVTNQPPEMPPADDNIDSLRQKAEAGDARAQLILGLDYRDGDGVVKDYVEAAKWFRKSADLGNAHAQFFLGVLYDKGQGVTKDNSVAASWYRKAANQGNASAQFNLGIMYNIGEGVTKDNSLAANWFRKAADQGNASAQYNLGHMYADGEGVAKDALEALKWYRKAAEQGHARAQFNLGHMYADGEGVPQDYIEAQAWFIVSSSSGLEQAAKQRDLGERIIGVQSTLLAQQRSKVILKEIEQAKAQASKSDDAETDRALSGQPKGSGSGVFISKDGLVITAAHVVKDAISIKILTQQGLKSAQVLKIDLSNDVAILKCDGQFQAVPIKSSSGVKLGQSVFTIGFPDTQLQGFSPKMTQGEISSLSGIQDDPRDWQISVPVQPGNSGGPLFDSHGNVIGLVVAKLDALVTAQATGALPEDVNYAVKTAYVLPLLDAYTANLLSEATTTAEPEKIEDVVGRVQNSVVLILVY